MSMPAIERRSKYIGACALGVNVCLNMHQDLGDFSWSDTSVHLSGDHRPSDRVLAYFCFPTLGIAVPLRCGDHLLFNPAVPHMVSSRSRTSDKIYCVSLYMKKNLLGGNDNSLPLDETQKFILDAYNSN